uniref:Photosystem I assembly protein Ycf4 n=6 Tax=Chamaecyparis TaxID=13414 RepID=A0A1U7EGP3_9CONI|nr:photosystem I assembly protein Ycf4 [Chamaecyparis pisifera]AQM39016.1 photosystem I assembly protein Ycf4 [Chamaecyparis lawsoniana]AQM39099.1 photosystem I assembly protein Ycf4 [Chamaecyparis hodginsii]QJE70825.1 photosystem I assembly protein Ycf4 [Chamaecyparis obtusa]BCB64035.1 photosystem I assembly protein Ycf4 [Chamaecyparis obtusa var. formosana]BCB64865.1 photosystem I assembly protein Ycf4 [Chamaecyparis obtusa var. obtusa]
MNRRSKWLWIEPIKGSRKISNFFFACLLFLGSLGFFVVGISSYLGRNLIPLLSSQQILFVPQGIVMCFYGIAGLFISSYLWCTILCNVGSGYNKFDEKEGVVCLFRWGFPGRNRRIFLQFLMKDIQAIKMEVQEGIFPRRVIYMEIKGQQDIPLTRTEENLTLREMEQKAAELARFLRVSIEGF